MEEAEQEIVESPTSPQFQSKPGIPQLTPEQIKLIQLYQAWKENLVNFEPGDLYHMQADIISAIIDMETCDYQVQIDYLVEQLNETREKVGLPPMEDEDEDEEGEEETNEGENVEQ